MATIGTYSLDGRPQVYHYNNQDVVSIGVHRLVAIAHGADPYKVFSGDYHIHHKNELEWDNRPENLQLLKAEEHGKKHVPEDPELVAKELWEQRLEKVPEKHEVYARKNWQDLKAPFNLIKKLSEKYDLSQEVTDRAIDLYIEYRKSKFQFNNSSRVAMAVLLLSTHDSDHPVPTKYIQSGVDMNQNEIMSEYRRVSSRLNLGILPPQSYEYLSFVSKQNKISEVWESETKRLLRGYEKNVGSNGKSPTVILGAGLYASPQLSKHMVGSKTQEEVANMLGISKVAIRNNYRDLLDFGQTLKTFSKPNL